MAGLKLYYHPQSPYARGVTILLDVLGIECEKQFVDLFAGEAKTPEYLEMNIQHTVPLLLDGDFKLNESIAIMTYLIEKYGGHKKYILPSDDLQVRAKVLEKSLFATGVFFDAFIQSAAPRMFRGEKEFNHSKIERLNESLGFFTHFIKDTGYLAGTKDISMADLLALSMYDTVKGTGKHVVDLDKYPEVRVWYEKVKAQVPNYPESGGKGAKMFQDFFQKRTGLE